MVLLFPVRPVVQDLLADVDPVVEAHLVCHGELRQVVVGLECGARRGCSQGAAINLALLVTHVLVFGVRVLPCDVTIVECHPPLFSPDCHDLAVLFSLVVLSDGHGLQAAAYPALACVVFPGRAAVCTDDWGSVLLGLELMERFRS